MTPRNRSAVSAIAVLIALTSFPRLLQSSLEKLRTDYQAVTVELQKHITLDFWIDDDPESPKLLARHWSLAAAWVAGWLDSHPAAGPNGVKAAFAELVPHSEADSLELAEETYLVRAPDSFGNVFIVTKSDGHFRVLWSTAQAQEANGKVAEILAAWRPENARHGGRGPYWASAGSAGSVLAQKIARLPADAEGRPRFYIEGMYAQSAGATVGAQVSLWMWDGKTAHPLVARDYAVMVEQKLGTRIEGDLLKVQQKKFFRTFFSCGGCEERQTDWIVRLTPHGFEDLGERSMTPALDVVDELFYRVIHHQSAADIASPDATKAAEMLIEEARAGSTEKEWEEFPSLGMMGSWMIEDGARGRITLCLWLDDVGGNLFTLASEGGKPFITELKRTDRTCEK